MRRILATALLVSGCSVEKTPAEQKQLDDAVWIYMAKDNVKSALRDPDSAIFGNMTVKKSGEITATCGTVNSRNGFGGMSGPTQFISGGATVIEGQIDDAEFIKLWAALC